MYALTTVLAAATIIVSANAAFAQNRLRQPPVAQARGAAAQFDQFSRGVNRPIPPQAATSQGFFPVDTSNLRSPNR